MENEVVLSQEEAGRLYSLLATSRQPLDPVLGRLLHRLEDHLYRTLTIEEIERLQGGRDPGEGPRGPR